MNQREKAARIKAAEKVKAAGVAAGEFLPALQAEWLATNEYVNFSTRHAIDLQVAVDEAVELMRETFDYYCGPHASGSLTCNCNSCGLCEMRSKLADWLSRNERKEV